MIARPSATRCCWPPESCDGLRVEQRRRARAGRRRAARRAVALGGRHAAHPQPEHDVLGDRKVREQRVALEHHRDVALRRRQRRDVAPADQDAAAVGHARARRSGAASSTCRSPTGPSSTLSVPASNANESPSTARTWPSAVVQCLLTFSTTMADNAPPGAGRPAALDAALRAASGRNHSKDGARARAPPLARQPNSARSAAPGIGRAHERLADEERVDAVARAAARRRPASRMPLSVTTSALGGNARQQIERRRAAKRRKCAGCGC